MERCRKILVGFSGRLPDPLYKQLVDALNLAEASVNRPETFVARYLVNLLEREASPGRFWDPFELLALLRSAQVEEGPSPSSAP